MARIRDTALIEAIDRVGIGRIAEVCGITPQAVSLWDRVPALRVLAVEKASGIPRERLRPDLYGAPRPRPRRRQTIEAAA